MTWSVYISGLFERFTDDETGDYPHSIINIRFFAVLGDAGGGR